MYSQDPDWVDIHWLYSGELLQLAVSTGEKGDSNRARLLLIQSREISERCLIIEENNPICKFLLGSTLGQIATIDGVFSSMRSASRVYTLWMDVINSPYNHMLTDKISLQSKARYAMGVFMRVIPDWKILEWFFGIKGDIDLSIRMLEESMIIDGFYPCGQLMLAASRLCRADENLKSADYQEGINELKLIDEMEHHSVQSDICKRDSRLILNQPKLACGYTTAGQQELRTQEKL